MILIYNSIYQQLKMRFNKSAFKENISCGIIAFTNNFKQLLIVRNQSKWGFPKGHRKSSFESFASCAHREAQEETGLYFPIYNNSNKLRIFDNYYFPFVVNNAEAYAPIPIDTKEILEVKWVNIDIIQNFSKNRDLSIFLKKYLDLIIKRIKKYNLIVNIDIPRTKMNLEKWR